MRLSVSVDHKNHDRVSPSPQFRWSLRSLSLAASLSLDLPVREQIFVVATGALPGTTHRIGTTLMKHFNDQVAMQTHRRMTENNFILVNHLGNYLWSQRLGSNGLSGD